jgi:urea carboxylase
MATSIQPGSLIHERAVFRPLGDRFLTMEFGEEPTVACNLRVVAMREALKNARIPGVSGYIMVPRALAAVYDPLATDFDRLCAALREVEQDAGQLEVVRSRLFDIPVWYDDPWTQECARANKVQNNVEFVAEQNNLSKDQLIQRISTMQYWIAAVFFYIGAYNAFPIDPEGVFSAPKYVVPRTFTPDRTVAYAGTYIGSYALPGPGGYQLLGRTPVNFFEPEPLNSYFREHGRTILCQYSDRHLYRAIGEDEYNAIRAEVEAGTYEYQVRDESFNIKRYTEAVLRGNPIRPEAFFEA